MLTVEIGKKKYNVVRFSQRKAYCFSAWPFMRRYCIDGMYYMPPFRYTPAPPLKGKSKVYDGNPNPTKPIFMDITDRRIKVNGVKFDLSNIECQNSLRRYLEDLAAVELL